MALSSPAIDETTDLAHDLLQDPIVPWQTVVWDDPVNLMSYVTYVFRTYFGFTLDRATALMLDVQHRGHVFTAEHNAFNCSPLAVLNVARDSMAQVGFSPATRVFEAAGATSEVARDGRRRLSSILFA